MDVLEAIHSRRSMGKVRPDPLPRAIIEELLEAAVWAPNHHRTEPWRFFVFAGAGRDRLAMAFAEAEGEKGRDRPYRAPVVIAVAAVPQAAADNAQEEICATAAAIQNLLLAAEGRGIAAIWRTGSLASAPEVRRLLGLGERDALLGFIYLGYPDPAAVKPQGRRTPAAEKTVWYE